MGEQNCAFDGCADPSKILFVTISDIDKVRFYLDNPQARKRVAVAGRERCLSSGYSYEEGLRASLTAVYEEILNGRIN